MKESVALEAREGAAAVLQCADGTTSIGVVKEREMGCSIEACPVRLMRLSLVWKLRLRSLDLEKLRLQQERECECSREFGCYGKVTSL